MLLVQLPSRDVVAEGVVARTSWTYRYDARRKMSWMRTRKKINMVWIDQSEATELTAIEETSSPLVVEDAQLFPPELVLLDIRLFKPLNLGPTDSLIPAPPT